MLLKVQCSITVCELADSLAATVDGSPLVLETTIRVQAALIRTILEIHRPPFCRRHQSQSSTGLFARLTVASDGHMEDCGEYKDLSLPVIEDGAVESDGSCFAINGPR